MARGILSCAACTRRAVQAFNAAHRPVTARPLPFRQMRFYAVETIANPRTGSNAPGVPRMEQTSPHEEKDVPEERLHSGAELFGPKGLDAPQDLEDADVSKSQHTKRLNKAVNAHLDRMNDDPYTIGKYVERALARGAFEEAHLLVVKATSRTDHQLTVSWNALIDQMLKEDKIKDAIKLYNDMKKRQQYPNDRTYTIIFRGLASCSNKHLAVQTAVKHFDILLKNKDKDKATTVQPNSYHVNSVLTACTQAADMKALFHVINSLDDSKLAPTTQTYTIIFNALRHNTLRELETMPDEEEQMANVKRSKLVEDVRGLWNEVHDKWLKRKLDLDEELVCAVGHALLLGPEKAEKLEALNVIESTMDIPNFAGGRTFDLHEQHRRKDGPVNRRSHAGKPIPAVIAGTRTLGLVLNLTQEYGAAKPGLAYWKAMVDDGWIVPDANNWLSLFFLLRRTHDSTAVGKILAEQKVPKEFLELRHHRLAMYTCLADAQHNNMVVENSTKVVDSMLRTSKFPDLDVLSMHLRVSLVATSLHRQRALRDGDDRRNACLDYGRQILDALNHIWEPYRRVHYHFFTIVPSRSAEKTAKKYAEKNPRSHTRPRSDVIYLARQMASALHKIIREELVPLKEMEAVNSVYAKINRDIQWFAQNCSPEEGQMEASTEELKTLPTAHGAWRTYQRPRRSRRAKREPGSPSST